MKCLKVSSLVRGVIPFAVAFFLVATFARVGVAQSDPPIRTWKLNVARSLYTPGNKPPTTGTTIRFETSGEGLKRSDIDAEGKPTVLYSANFDGKDYPITNPNFDTSQ